MKIGVDIRVLMDKNYSGVADYTSILLRELLKKDGSDNFYLFYNSFRNVADRIGNFDYDNVEIKRLPYPNKIFNYFLQSSLAYPKLDKAVGKTDIFWSPHINFTRISKDTKHLLTIHDLSFLRYPEFFNRRKNLWHKALRVKKLANEASMIVAVSENTRQDVIELLGVAKEKVKTIYSGVNPVVSLPNTEEAQRFIRRNNLNSRFILYLGTIEPRKNLAGLIYAYNRFRDENIKLVDVQLVLAGAKGWRHRDIFRAWENSPYRNDIKFLGYVSAAEKELLYQRAEVFIYPSYYEGFGLPVLEAMDRGLAVITSNISSVPEVAANAALILNPYDINEIAKAMELMINNPDLRHDFIRAGKERSKLFSWEKTAEEYLTLFRSM